MRYIDDDSVKAIEKHKQLRKIFEEKNKMWEEAAKKSRTDEEYEQTRPLFDDAMKAYEEWKNHFYANGRKILMQRDD